MNKKLKICHIVTWYPNKWNNKEAIWTKRHIEGLDIHCSNSVYHVQLKYGKWKKHFYRISNNEQAFILTSNTNIWFFRELLSTLLLIYVIIFKIKNKKQYDAFNFQITYPLLTYSKLITWILKKPIIVTEHWSAYHLNFESSKELKRIKRIFKNKKLNFICVSDALRQDIENFSGVNIKYKIVGNIIDCNIFKNLSKERNENSFFMLSYWKEPKDPFLILNVFAKLKSENIKFTLNIGGFGPLEDEMKILVSKLDLNDSVNFLGKLNTDEIVEEMNKVQYFIHNSNYEVSSVVCIEAISCGTPVIASNVGGIKEYVNSKNGFLIEENTFENWYKKLVLCTNETYKFDNSKISRVGLTHFSKENVAKSYFDALQYFIKKEN